MRILILGGTVFLGRHVATKRSRAATRSRSTAAASTASRTRRCRARDRRPRRRHAAARPRVGRRDRHVRLRPAHVEASARRSTSATTCSSRAATPIPTGPTSRSTRTRRRGRTARATGRTRRRPSAWRMPPGRRFATVRAGLIVGPHDNIFRLPWWVRRIAEGGDVPGARATPSGELQIIDARDLAASCSISPSSGRRRVQRHRRRSGRRRCASCSRRPATPSCAGSPTSKLEAAEVEPWTSCRCGCRPTRIAGTWRIGTAKRAQAAGLRCRPVAETVRRRPRLAGERRRGSELDDWRAEHRPPRMSAEREACANPTPVLGIRARLTR